MRLEDRVARAVTGPGRVPAVTPAVDDSQVSVPPMSMRMCIASP